MLRYLEMDVRQLCDVYENFRELTRLGGLDGAHYMTILQYALSAALKYIKKPIDLCDSPEMYRLFEKSIRGGLAFCNYHKVTANNKYVNSTSEGSDSIFYVDQNNLYGTALRMKLPVANFKMINLNEE